MITLFVWYLPFDLFSMGLRSHTETRKLPHHVKVVTLFVAWPYAPIGSTTMMMMMMMV